LRNINLKSLKMKISLIQEDILKILATRLPYSYDTVKYVFQELKSIDKTIAFLEMCLTNPSQALTMLNALKNLL